MYATFFRKPPSDWRGQCEKLTPLIGGFFSGGQRSDPLIGGVNKPRPVSYYRSSPPDSCRRFPQRKGGYTCECGVVCGILTLPFAAATTSSTLSTTTTSLLRAPLHLLSGRNFNAVLSTPVVFPDTACGRIEACHCWLPDTSPGFYCFSPLRTAPLLP